VGLSIESPALPWPPAFFSSDLLEEEVYLHFVSEFMYQDITRYLTVGKQNPTSSRSTSLNHLTSTDMCVNSRLLLFRRNKHYKHLQVQYRPSYSCPEQSPQVQCWTWRKSIEEASGLYHIWQRGHTGRCGRSDHCSSLGCNGKSTLMSLGALVPLQVIFALEPATAMRASESGPSLVFVFVVAFKVLRVSEAE
jgi:hypothetical protein